MKVLATQANIETMSAILAYSEEFTYYAAEVPEDFDFLAKGLFTEKHGKKEADKIDWVVVSKHYLGV